ncbi:MAG: ribonuclease III [Kiritimatiellia bacterium]|jgi:ribonuclease-3|nr:ribonuclease III [Kiritimatiellia bacterium]
MVLGKRNPYGELEKRLGYKFKDRSLLEMALTHRSFRYERTDVAVDNQRLEFLGDAVLDLVLAEYLYSKFSEEDEGFLTSFRSRIASGRSLAKYGRDLGLGEFIKIGRGEEVSGGRQRPSNMADALESIIGAVYLDRGLKGVQRLFNTVFAPACRDIAGDAWSDNPKGRLQEYTQRNWKSSPEYRLTSSDGPPHARVFTVEAMLPDGASSSASESSKQKAEAAAAKKLLAVLDKSKRASGK